MSLEAREISPRHFLTFSSDPDGSWSWSGLGPLLFFDPFELKRLLSWLYSVDLSPPQLKRFTHKRIDWKISNQKRRIDEGGQARGGPEASALGSSRLCSLWFHFVVFCVLWKASSLNVWLKGQQGNYDGGQVKNKTTKKKLLRGVFLSYQDGVLKPKQHIW